MTRVAMMGGGSWGTAFAVVLAEAGSQVTLWTRGEEMAADINQFHRNSRYHPDVDIPETIIATTDPQEALQSAEIVVLAVPAQSLRANLMDWAPWIGDEAVYVSLIKGIELGTSMRMSEVIAEVTGADPQRIAVVSGPNLAKEIIARQPTATTVAASTQASAVAIQQACTTDYFRPYWTTDVIGTEIGGAVKNVLAIVCGIVLGKGLGRSAHAAIMARGFAEMTRLGIALGARPDTLTGLCGLGDLVLTCSSEMSRNMSCGLALGRGETLDTILQGRLAVTEGVATAPALKKLAQEHDVDMPISFALADILAGHMTVDEAMVDLMSREHRFEAE